MALQALEPTSRDALAKKHWPKGMAFDAAHEQLLSRGWPHLCVLDDGVTGKKAQTIAFANLSSLDPTRFVYWPREAARGFLHAFAKTGETCFKREQVAAELASTTPVTAALIAPCLAPAAGVTGYGFHILDAIFLLEAFLGTDVLADAVLSWFEKPNKDMWAESNPHLKAVWLVFALECLLLRSTPKARAAGVKRLVALGKKRGYTLARRIEVSLKGFTAWRKHADGFLYNTPFLTVDEAALPAYFEHEYAAWLVTPQLLRIGGPTIVTDAMFDGMRRDAAWKQQERCAVFGPIRHAVTVKMMASLLGSKGAKGMPEAWLASHLDFARPTLEKLGEGHKSAAVVKKLLGGKQLAAPRKMTESQLDALGAKLLRQVVRDVRKVRGDHAAEAAAITTMVHALIEARAAAGVIIPSAHVGHFFGADGWGDVPPPMKTLKATDEESERWFAVLNAACD